MKIHKKVLFMGIALLLGCSRLHAHTGDNAHMTSDKFNLSERRIQISSQGHVAIFQLYDTAAAKELYQQLPLKLELSNFRQAQWMFFPPEKLNVNANEAYHDGKKGELSYYAPWGDVFMLYKDFYAGDHMHRLGVVIEGIDSIEPMSGTAVIEKH
ncbi:cyclophilin-like fold protein [Vibrio brasiliensis]